MLQRLVTVLVGIPAAALLVALAVINRHEASLALDPFSPQDPAIGPLVLPFYMFLFGSLFAGVIAGGMAVWLSQGKFRATARTRAQEARRWQAEADRLARERDARVGEGLGGSMGQGKQLALLNR